MNAPQRKCGNCDHCHMDKQADGSLASFCRRLPPQLNSVVVPTNRGLNVQMVSGWPTVAPDAHCGEFKPRVLIH